MALSSNDIVNRAIFQIGQNQPAVTGNFPTFDTSPAGVAASVLYAGVVQTVGRQFGYDFSRNTATLVATGNTPPPQWAYEYTYPTNGIQVRQIMPGTITDANNPSPIRFIIGNVLVSSAPTKVIWTNQASALAIFSNQPPEALWDAEFTEAVVRLLASEMAMAIPGRPETSQNAFQAAQGFQNSAEGRDG